ncbi:MAG: hypothetical protein ACTSX4_11075 [Candidatus Helarchaeota archaeon]
MAFGIFELILQIMFQELSIMFILIPLIFMSLGAYLLYLAKKEIEPSD